MNINISDSLLNTITITGQEDTETTI